MSVKNRPAALGMTFAMVLAMLSGVLVQNCTATGEADDGQSTEVRTGLAPIVAQPFERSGHVWVVFNPAHELRIRMTRGRTWVEGSTDPWRVGYHIASIGREDHTFPLPEVSPLGVGCEDGRCPYIERHRGPLVERYASSIAGLEQHIQLDTPPPGDGPLVLDALVAGVSVEVEGDGAAAILRRGDDVVLAITAPDVIDARGIRLRSRLEWTPPTLRIQIDDGPASWPLRLSAALAPCPASWCADGDPSTIDICGDAGATCHHLLDDRLAGAPCTWGESCCSDGRYHPDCQAPAAPARCPDSWCDDRDAMTLDRCTNLVPSLGLFECHRQLDPSAETDHLMRSPSAGQACTSGPGCCPDGVARPTCL